MATTLLSHYRSNSTESKPAPSRDRPHHGIGAARVYKAIEPTAAMSPTDRGARPPSHGMTFACVPIGVP